MPTPRILESTQENLAALSALSGNDRCILTVYFPGSTGGVRADPLSQDLLKEITSISQAGDLSEDEREHLERCVADWQASMEGFQLDDAPGWIGVVSWLSEDVALIPLPDAVRPSAFLDNSPFLYPAGQLLDDRESYVVAYMDHRRAVIYVASLGKLQEEERLRGDIKNHVRKGGWSQQRYERRRDKQIHEFCEKLVNRLRKIVEGEELRRIVLIGDKHLTAEFQRHLPDALLAMVIDVMVSENNAEASDLYQVTFESASTEEKREEERILKQIQENRSNSGKAVTGPQAVLDALVSRRAHTLLLGPMDDVRVWRCRECGQLGLGYPKNCLQCDSSDSVYSQDAANELADLAYEGGCTVEFTTNPLQEIDGVGALLRW